MVIVCVLLNETGIVCCSSRLYATCIEIVTEALGRFPGTPPSRASPHSFDADNNIDFVEKVSKFELLSHSSSLSPPVVSADSLRWFVRDGIRSTPPSRASSATPLPSSPKSPRLSVMAQNSGRCTPTSPGLTQRRVSHDDIQACEEELAQQHRRAVAERLRDQEQERQERQRLEEILNLCAEYQRHSSQDALLRTSPDSNTEDAPASESSPPRDTDKTSSHPSESSVTSVTTTTEEEKGATNDTDAKRKTVTPDNQRPAKSSGGAGAINKHEDTMEETRTTMRAAKKPAPEPAPRTIRCHSTEGSPGSHYHNRIKTNGSLTAAAAAAMASTGSESEGKHGIWNESGIPAPKALLSIGKKPLNATSSEDELTNIFGTGEGSSKSSPQSEADIAAVPAPVQSSAIPLSRPVGSSPRLNIRTVVTSLQGSGTSWAPHESSSWDDGVVRHLPERGGSLTFGKGSMDRIQMPLRQARSTSDDMSLLKRQREGSLHQIAKLKTDIITLEARVSEGIHELELEHALVTGELSDAQACQEEDLMALEEVQQKELLLARCRVQDREHERLQLESHASRIAHWEQVTRALLNELTACSDTGGSSCGHTRSEVEPEYHCALEALEAERRAYEDLEFGQLEQDARLEEEREALLLRSHNMRDSIRERQAKIRELMEQQKAIAMQIEQEKSISGLDKRLIQTQLQQEQRKLDILDQRLRDLTPQLETTCIDEDSSSSSGSECDTVFKPDVWSHWKNRQFPLDSLGIPGNDCDLSVEESESSSIVSSSDMRNESVSSSSEDRSRPTSEDVPSQGALQVQQHKHMQALNSEEGSVLLPRSGDDAIHEEIRRREKHKGQRPLTRYLPVRDLVCDLRQHVESAGHQVELCPHVRLSSTSCCGYLLKLGGRWCSWKRQWFVFDRSHRALLYFADKTQAKLKGALPFQVIEEVYVDHQQSSGKSTLVGFCVKTRMRTFHLAAPTPEAMRIWVDVIFTGAEGYLEFLPDEPVLPRRTKD